MNPELVLQKTPKGREEIAKRTHRLDGRRRMVLIVVDGQSTAKETAAKVAHIEDCMALLQSLWTDGFIEPFGDSASGVPVAPIGASRDRSAGKGIGAVSLEQLKRNACATIERLMGPDGDSLALKIERVTSREEFFIEARKAHDALASFLGPRKAAQFSEAIGL